MRHQIVAGLEVTCFLIFTFDIFIANRPFDSIANISKFTQQCNDQPVQRSH